MQHRQKDMTLFFFANGMKRQKTTMMKFRHKNQRNTMIRKSRKIKTRETCNTYSANKSKKTQTSVLKEKRTNVQRSEEQENQIKEKKKTGPGAGCFRSLHSQSKLESFNGEILKLFQYFPNTK